MPEPEIEPVQPVKVEFTAEQHAEMNRIIQARTAEEARKVVRDERARTDAYLADEKAKQDLAQLDGIEKANAETAAAVKRATDAEDRAAKIEARSNATAALITAKVDPKALADALRLIDTSADDLDAEVKALSERLPALFTTADPGAPAPKFGIDPPRNPPAGGGKTGVSAGADRYKSRTAA